MLEMECCRWKPLWPAMHCMRAYGTKPIRYSLPWTFGWKIGNCDCWRQDAWGSSRVDQFLVTKMNIPCCVLGGVFECAWNNRIQTDQEGLNSQKLLYLQTSNYFKLVFTCFGFIGNTFRKFEQDFEKWVKPYNKTSKMLPQFLKVLKGNHKRLKLPDEEHLHLKGSLYKKIEEKFRKGYWAQEIVITLFLH